MRSRRRFALLLLTVSWSLSAGCRATGATTGAEIASAPFDVPCRPVRLVPLMEADRGQLGPRSARLDAATRRLERLAAEYEARYGITATVGPHRMLPEAAFDTERQQYEAGHLLGDLASLHDGQEENAPAIIGVTDADLHALSYPHWRYVFSLRLRAHPVAIVSTYRMADEGHAPDGGRFDHRLRVMVAKNVGALACGLPMSDHPGSVMYDRVLSPADLDAMSDDLRTAPRPRGLEGEPATARP